MSTVFRRTAWLGVLLVMVGCPKPVPQLQFLTISPENARVPVGASQHFVASGLFSDGSTKVLTDQVSWTVDDALVATMTSEAGVVQALKQGDTQLRARMAGVTGTRTFTVADAQIQLVQIYPPRPVAPLGLQVQVQAIVVNTDQTVQNVTDQALWQSSDTAIVEVTAGRLTGHTPGSATLSVSYQGVLAQVPVEVTAASVQRLDLSPWNATIPAGVTLRYAANATLSDRTSIDVSGSVEWSSTDPATAFVNNAGADKGVVVARVPGQATLAAALGSITATTPISVSAALLTRLDLTPASGTIALGTSVDLVATGVFSDGTSRDVSAQVSWSVAPTGLARLEVGTPGRVKGLGVGAATVTATLGSISGTASLTITPAVVTSLSLTPAAPTLAVGTHASMVATGLFSDGSRQELTTQVVWTCANRDLASISNAAGSRGEVLALAQGTTQLGAQFGTVSASVPLIITPAVLVSLQLSPSAPTLPLGTSAHLTATGVFSDGSRQDVTQQASWSSTAPAVANVTTSGSQRGVVQASSLGSATITASVLGQSASTIVTVTNAVLVSLSLTPSTATLARGTQGPFVATGVYSDNSTQALTSQVTWTSSDPSVASVSNASGSAGMATAVGVGSADIRAQSGSIAAAARLTVTPAQVRLVEVAPVAPTVPAGRTRAFTAIATLTDATTQDVTAQVIWASSAPAVASVSNAPSSQGLVSALTAGTSTISATIQGQVGSSVITVTPAALVSLSLRPGSLSLSRGSSAGLTAIGTYTDGTTADLTAQVTWTSADATIASVSNGVGTSGVVQAVAVGDTVITARSGAITITATVSVTPAVLLSLSLTPVLSALPLGASANFAATGTYSDGTTQDLTTQATWTSSDAAIISVSTAPGTQGRARALQQGSATITAATAGKTASLTITVTAASLASLTLTPASPVLANLTSVRLQATGTWTDGATRDVTTQVTWASSVTAVAQVSNASSTEGRVTATAPGTTSISATLGSISGATTLTVTAATLLAIDLTPLAPSAPAGLTAQLMATGRFSDGTTQDLTDQSNWTSSDSTRASVSSLGLVTAVLVGAPTISATAIGVTGSTTFTVTSALLTALDLTPALATIPRGLTQGFTASGIFTDGSTSDVTAQVTWSSSDALIASISNASGSAGLASGLSTGTVTITASLRGVSATARLNVTPASLVSLAVTPVASTLPRGLTAQLTATGTYTDGTTQELTAQASWSSTDAAIASVSSAVSSAGLVSAAGVGQATITAQVGSVSGTASITVSPAQLSSVGIAPANPRVPVGLTEQLALTGVYTDGTTQDLTALATWSSSDLAVAQISNASGSEGLATALAQGTATITAQYASFTTTTTFTVTMAVLRQLQITPNAPSIPSGLTQALTATGVYSDSSTQDLTTQVTWGTSNAAIATVSNATPGLVSALLPGTATITAASGSVSGSILFTVTPAVLQALQVTPANSSRPRGVPEQFVATGLYSNGGTQDLTASVTWTSSDATTVNISNATGSEGHASTLRVGSVTITATSGGISGSTPFTVSPAVLVSVALSPNAPNLPLGSVRQFSLIGTYTDGSTQNLTAQASFLSADPSIIDISNAGGSVGLATTFTTGSTTVSASALGFSASTPVRVTQAALASIDLTPSNGSTALGFTRQFIAIGTYTDSTTQVLTTQATWASSDTTKAFISNAGGSHGVLSTVAAGTVTISATWNGVTGTTTHTINPAVLVGLSITPASFSVSVAGTRQLTATGDFSDGSQQDVTSAVTWTSSASGVAQVSNAGGSHGLATGIAVGNATITATSGTQSATASATVTP